MKEFFDVHHGNANDVLSKLVKNPKENNKYRLIVTSPPYYKHRNYGKKSDEIGQEKTDEEYLDNLVDIFSKCKNLLTDDGSLFIVIGDTRRKHAKLMIPHRLAIKLNTVGYTFQEDIIWHKKNAVPNSSKTSLAQAYEFILFLSKQEVPYINMDSVRVQGNEVLSGTNKVPPNHMIQFKAMEKNTSVIKKIADIVHNATPDTPFDDLPSTTEISWAYGYDPEKYCPTCHRKFKRHATRKRIGDHKHYPIFAACNPKGKKSGNVWEISTKAHHGNEHFAMFPEDLIAKIVKFTTKPKDFVLDPFVGRGTSGIVSACLKRKFTGIDLYSTNVSKTKKNIQDALDSKLPQKILNQILTTKPNIGDFF